MTPNKNSSPAGNEWLSKLTGLFESTDKNLDQVKKSVQSDLNKLRKEKSFENLAANFYSSAEAGFKKDLDEISISGDKQKPYLAIFKEAWQKEEMGKKSAEILNSPELKAMDEFISRTENLPKLKEVIDSAQPQAKWQVMLSGIFGTIPGLESKWKEYFEPVLSAVGLGFLLKPKKKKEKEEAGKKTSPKKPKGSREAKEVLKIPKSTVFFGDSNTVAMTQKSKDILKIDGKIKSVAQGGESAAWGLEQARRMAAQKPSPLKDFENAVVLFGSNDLLAYSVDKEIETLKALYKTLKDAGVKRVYAVTIPPVKGFHGYDRAARSFNNRHAINEWIRKSKKAGFSDAVIDLAAKESKGGIADNKDPEKLCKNAHSSDGIHVDKRLLATVYQRELESGTA